MTVTKYVVWRVFYGVFHGERVVLAKEYVATCSNPAKAEALRVGASDRRRGVVGEVESVAVAANIADLDLVEAA